MAESKFIWCRNCDAIHHVSAFDRSPVFHYTAGEFTEVAANDWRDFMAHHNGHKLESLVGTGNHYSPKNSPADPMNTAYVEATDGKDTLLLRLNRRTIEDPIDYQIIPARLVESDSRLEVQENEIRKEMQLHFKWAPAKPLAKEKIDLFVGLFREIVSGLDPRSMSTCADSFTDDNVSYCEIDAAVVAALMTKCSRYFSPLEIGSLGRFVDTHLDGCDVMALIKRRSVTIEQHA